MRIDAEGMKHFRDEEEAKNAKSLVQAVCQHGLAASRSAHQQQEVRAGETSSACRASAYGRESEIH